MRVFLAGLVCGAVSGGLSFNSTGDARAAVAVAIIVAVLAWAGFAFAFAVIELGD
ncbi:hypothetical protein ABZ467_38335 [Streptomyces sp. NPDC005727]|uniref:hypothetical protein n=1 Tax=Streptomyces sp. NPDC005727 TaxID=3157053 RepID=UPI0033ED5A35